MAKIIGRRLKVMNWLLVFFICLGLILPQDALARRSAGGTDVEGFDFGDYALNLGITMGSAIIGGVAGDFMGSALGGTLDKFSLAGSFGNQFQVGNMIQGFSTAAACTQVTRAVAAYGTYHDWDSSKIFLVSSLANGITAGALNPQLSIIQPSGDVGGLLNAAYAIPTLPNMAKGAFVGGITELGKGYVIYAIDKKRIDKGKGPSALGQIAGMVAGTMATNFAREIVNPREKPASSLEQKSVQADSDSAIGSVTINGEKVDAYARLQVKGADAVYQELNQPQSLEERIQIESGDRFKLKVPEGLEADMQKAGVSPQSQPSVAEINTGGKLTLSKDWHSVMYRPQPQVPAERSFTYYNNGNRNIVGERFWVRVVDASPKTGIKTTSNPVDPTPYAQDTARYRMDPAEGLPDIRIVTDRFAPARPLRAAFVYTFQQWPQMATGAVGIMVKESLPKDKGYLAPLVSGIVEGMVGPVFQYAQAVKGWDPVRLIGAKNAPINMASNAGIKSSSNLPMSGGSAREERIAANLRYIGQLNTMAGAQAAAEIHKHLSDILKNHQQEWQNPSKPSDAQMAALRADAANFVSSRLAESGATGVDLDRALSSEDLVKSYEKVERAQGISEEEMARIKVDVQEAFRNVNNPQAYIRNVGNLAYNALQNRAQSEWQNTGSVDSVMQAFGTSKSELFSRGVADSIRFNMLDAVTGGLVQAVFQKNMNDAKPYQQMTAALAANMATGVVRGIARHNSDLYYSGDWGTRADITMPVEKPERPSADASPAAWMDYADGIRSYNNQAYEFGRAGQLTGLGSTAERKPVGKYGKESMIFSVEVIPEGWVNGNMDMPVARKPSLGQQVAFSIAQASHEGLFKTFSFSHPMATDYVSALEYSGYLSEVNTIASQAASTGFSKVLAGSFASANLGAATNNIQGIAAQSAGLRRVFNIAPERVIMTNSPKAPMAIQQMQHVGARGYTRSRIIAPSPNAGYRVSSDLGSSGTYLIDNEFPQVEEKEGVRQFVSSDGQTSQPIEKRAEIIDDNAKIVLEAHQITEAGAYKKYSAQPGHELKIGEDGLYHNVEIKTVEPKPTSSGVIGAANNPDYYLEGHIIRD